MTMRNRGEKTRGGEGSVLLGIEEAQRIVLAGVVPPAGEPRAVPVAPGEAVKIMTGAPVPPGCDTVIPVENVEADGDGIRLLRPVVPGDHVRKRGEDLRQGERVIPSGAYLRPQEIGMLASLGGVSGGGFRKARGAILATGGG